MANFVSLICCVLALVNFGVRRILSVYRFSQGKLMPSAWKFVSLLVMMDKILKFDNPQGKTNEHISYIE